MGEFTLTRLRAAPRGEVELEVTFKINADGIVSVSARNLETGQEQAITVTAQSGLTEDEIRAMAIENQDHLVDLRRNERVIDLKQKIERTLLSMDHIMPRVNTLLENNAFAQEALIKANEVVSRSKESMQSDDIELLERDFKALTRTLNMFHTVIEKLKRR